MVRFIIALVFLFLFTGSAQAQTSLIIKPAVITLKTASSSASITVYNAGDSELDLKYTSLWLEAGKDGQLYPTVPIKPVSGITALNNESENNTFTLLPRSSHQVRFSIPANIIFTNRIPALMFSTQSQPLPEEKTVSSLNGSIIVPVIRFGDVSRQELRIARFEAPGITTSSKLPFALTVHNPGKTPTQVSGTITVKNILNREIARFPLNEHIILPQQFRDLMSDEKIVWDPKLILGFYLTELRLEYGNKSTVHRKIIFGLPYRYAAILGISALIGSGIYLRVRKYRQ